MICFPTAKINLGLRIIDKRPDGYHNIETFFYPIGLKDALEVVPAADLPDFRLTVSGTEERIEQPSNLVTKAFRLLQQSYGLPPLDAYLHKAIPSGAGLGGGSSDAAFMLSLINRLFDCEISTDVMKHMASQLGADCPFFLTNKPVFATGTGDKFEETTLSLKGYFLVVVKPPVSVSTSEAYANINPNRPHQSLKEVANLPVTAWKGVMYNDFETYAFHVHPVIGDIKQRLYDKGALYASMSGSGSAVYGIFKDVVELQSDFPSLFYWSSTL